LEKEVVARRQKLLEDAGITFHLNFHVGKDATLEALQRQHSAVLIATGVYKAREIEIPDTSLSGIFPALDYLIASNRVCLGDTVADYENGVLNAAGKHFVVIGGGDTAMDCVRTAVRQGAKKVSCLYRRDRGNMPGSAREVKNAEEEGVEFIWLSAPKAFAGTKKLEKILGIKMRLGAPDATGRHAPIIIEDSQFTLKADMAIKALGFDAEDIPTAFGASELALSRHGTLAVDNATQMTSLPGVFAAGDIVRGASLVVWAIKDGRDAAHYMDKWIKAKQREKAA
jgi:glutamate synthase (NADPH/NADH) small chain